MVGSRSSPAAIWFKRISQWALQPSRCWVWVFLPAFFYYMATRLHSWGLFRSSSVGVVMESRVLTGSHGDSKACELLSYEWLYLAHRQSVDVHTTAKLQQCANVSRPIYRVLDQVDENSIVATTWKHDEELGRGYLLLSTSQGPGKVWQWETGGGPIPIGKTLNLLDSGCRSHPASICQQAQHGSGGIVVDPWHEPPRLLLAEWGQGRIIRLEPESGARTPIVIDYEEPFSSSQSPLKAYQPRQLLLTAFGDLIVLDSLPSANKDKPTKNRLWQIPQIPKISPLASLAESREAHEWTSLWNNDDKQNVTRPLALWDHPGSLGGVGLVPKEWDQIYVTVKWTTNDEGEGDEQSPSPIALIKLAVGDDDDDDDEDENDVKEDPAVPPSPPQSTVVLDYSAYTSRPGPMEVDAKGYLYLAVDDGILFVSPQYEILGVLELPVLKDNGESIVSLTLGEDKFLYFATSSSLYRIKVRHGPLSLPSDLVAKA